MAGSLTPGYVFPLKASAHRHGHKSRAFARRELIDPVELNREDSESAFGQSSTRASW